MANSERRELIRLLKDDGWIFLRQRGSHCQFIHPTKPGKITVPYRIKKNIELSVKRQMEKGKYEQEEIFNNRRIP